MAVILLVHLLKTLYVRILRKVDSENAWEIYFGTRAVKKGGRSLLRSIGPVGVILLVRYSRCDPIGPILCVCVCRTHRITITNFCLGKHLVSEDDLLKDQRGSPAYISPDVLSGEAHCHSHTGSTLSDSSVTGVLWTDWG